MNDRIIELTELLQKLAHGQIAPSKIIGTGYQNPRQSAFQYLADSIAEEIAKVK